MWPRSGNGGYKQKKSHRVIEAGFRTFGAYGGHLN